MMLGMVLVVLTILLANALAFQPPQVSTRGIYTALSPLFSLIKDETNTLDDNRPAMPTNINHYQISIEYCTGCRWMLKSFWIAQELLSTFGKEESLDTITIVPSSEKGIFQIRIHDHDTGNDVLLWDRKTKNGFPQPKDIKQMVRDQIDPNKYLGHSDTKERQSNQQQQDVVKGGNITSTTTTESQSSIEEEKRSGPYINPKYTPNPSISICYCTGCQWMLRGAYFGQELLTTFDNDEIKSVSLIPSKPWEKGGRFSIALDGELLFDRATEGRFPEPKEIKQMIRDRIVPEKDLGHSGVEGKPSNDNNSSDDDDEMDDDIAAETRKYFGVF